jgi:hypothetical protein
VTRAHAPRHKGYKQGLQGTRTGPSYYSCVLIGAGRGAREPRERQHRAAYTIFLHCWPKLFWANFRALTGIFSQTVGPSLTIWANPVQFWFQTWPAPPAMAMPRARSPCAVTNPTGLARILQGFQLFRALVEMLSQNAAAQFRPPAAVATWPCETHLCDSLPQLAQPGLRVSGAHSNQTVPATQHALARERAATK